MLDKKKKQKNRVVSAGVSLNVRESAGKAESHPRIWVSLHSCLAKAVLPTRGGGEQGQFALGPKQHWTCSDKMRSSVTLRSLLPRAPYVDLKPLIEDGNLQVYMYCVHARKRTSGAPRTHFCKISKFPGGMPPDTPQSILWCPTFCICSGPHILYLPWAPHFVFALGPTFCICSGPHILHLLWAPLTLLVALGKGIV